jgi:hypothetical protein
MLTTVLIYHVVLCKAAAECYPLGGSHQSSSSLNVHEVEQPYRLPIPHP